jgi:hypothetical protein
MYEGRFMAILPIEQAATERVGLLMAGIKPPIPGEPSEVAV